MGSIAHRLARFENRSQLGYAYSALRAASRQPANLYIAHSEAAMAVATDLLHDGRLVGIDVEDWFSEDLPLEARKHRPVRLLRNLERKLLTLGGYSACPSRAMSEALAREFGCPQPTVVYNAFPWSDRGSMDGLFKDRRDHRLPSIHWFSQTLGHGRGLDDLIAALPLLKHEAEVHLRGKPVSGFEDWLVHRVPEAWRGRIMVHGLVPNKELLSRITEHDIGFAGETPVIRSRDLTVTNKILYYLLAGLAVLASDTAGQREVATQAPGGVFLYPSGDAAALATRVDALLESADALRQAKAAALGAAERTFCWEHQEKALLESINRALNLSAT
jgi:glycosyltransferase involved in cell wall biosynthesis